jgi:hypothetical protein
LPAFTICAKCPATIRKRGTTGLCKNCLDGKTTAGQAPRTIAQDREKQRTTAELSSIKARYNEALKTIERQEKELRAVGVLDAGTDTYHIAPMRSAGTAEATVVMVASDWHVEENVRSAVVSGLNKYDLEIAKQRSVRFFQAGLRLIRLLNQDVTITNVVLALLGDFISNEIHDELKDLNEAAPMDALVSAQTMIVSGIEFLLRESKYSFTIPCHSGNHARTTQKTHFSAENGHSLEYLMYLHLAAYFRNEPRVTFIIPEGYHSYLKIYDQTIRFHHGHAVKYGGGVGGIYIPVNKAIAQWDKGRHADLDVFGHFHQLRDGGNFICNGSLIGYNGFALSIKADFEKPRQALFLIDKKRGRTCTWPILVD